MKRILLILAAIILPITAYANGMQKSEAEDFRKATECHAKPNRIIAVWHGRLAFYVLTEAGELKVLKGANAEYLLEYCVE